MKKALLYMAFIVAGILSCIEWSCNSSDKKTIGKYVYVEDAGYNNWHIHTDRQCKEVDYADYKTLDEFKQLQGKMMYCTKCVTDEQLEQLQKYQKQP